MGDIEIKGAEQFGTLARRLKEAGEKDLRKELYKGIERATKPVKTHIKANAGTYMPSGYAAKFQGSLKLTTSKRASASNPGISLRAKAKGKSRPRLVGQIDQGNIRHPLFGNREFWYTTKIKPGFFTSEAMKGAPDVKKEILKAMNDVAEKAAHK